jgi:hypothetical protein
METPHTTPSEQIDGKSISVPAKSKFGIVGLILGIPGFVISASTAFFIYFIAMAGGGLDIMLTDTQWSTIVSTLYCGLLFGIVGGILGVVGLSRGENKIAGIISILFGLPTLCICSVAVFFSVFF